MSPPGPRRPHQRGAPPSRNPRHGEPPADAGRPGTHVAEVVGASRAWLEVVDLAQRAARSDARVLVTGESGVGKDVVARMVHAGSARATRPFVAVNCAGVAESLLESELFGHLQGSFTGAYRTTRGRAQVADTGTLFLDEVGETSLRLQALLLRFVETGEVQPVGAEAPVARVDVRIVAATNRHLADLVAAGRFREDLLYRLRVIHIHVPPLRERREDVPALIAHALARQPRPVTLSAAAQQALLRYHWPGNVRELENVVEQAVWLAPGDTIEVGHLPEAVRGQAAAVRVIHDRRRSTADRLFEALVTGTIGFWDHVHEWFLAREIARPDLQGLIARALAHTHGNYHAVLTLFHLPPEDYKRFLNFLATHRCNLDVQPFREGTADPRALRSPLPLDAPGAGPEVPGHGRGKNRAS